MKYKTHILFLIFPSISLLYCIFYSLYIYDGYHFGLIFSNAVELNNEKIPYKEIFIEYGYLTTLIHSIILKFIGNELLYLQIYTGFVYSISIYLIGLTTDIGRKYQANYAMLWLGILNAKRNGCSKFDIGGLNDDTPSGVAHFKNGLKSSMYSLSGEWRGVFLKNLIRF